MGWDIHITINAFLDWDWDLEYVWNIWVIWVKKLIVKIVLSIYLIYLNNQAFNCKSDNIICTTLVSLLS